VVQPGRKTSERILDALKTRFSERREMEESFGFLVTTPLPDVEDRRRARVVRQRDLD